MYTKFYKPISKYFVLLLLGYSCFAQAQESNSLPESKVLKEEVLLDESEKLKFDREIKSIQKEKEEKKSPKTFSMPKEVGQTFLILSILLLISLLLLLINRLYNTANKKIKSKDAWISEIKEVEENLPEVDIQSPLDRALKEGAFAIAIRLAYLQIIKELNKADQLKWKKQKTNGEYMAELYGQTTFAPFKKATNLYEKAWFSSEWDTTRLEQAYRDMNQRNKEIFEILNQRSNGK